MNSLNRYVLRQLAIGMIFVTVGLTCVIWLSQSLRLVDMIVNRGLSAGLFIFLTLLLLPHFLTIILPIALFTIVMFTYSKLISDRELLVMCATGMSEWALARPAIVLALIVVALGYLINLHLLPVSYKRFGDLKWEIRYSYGHVVLKEGAFNGIADGITVYVRERSKDGQLLGILLHDSRTQDRPFTVMAESGALVRTGTGNRVVLLNGNRQEIDPNTNELSILYFDRSYFDLPKSEAPGDIRYREARERTLHELFTIEAGQDLDPRDVGKFRVEGHKRLTSPFWALGYALVGLACLMGGSFSRHAQTRQIVLAVGLMIGLQTSALGLENWLAKNLSQIYLLYVHTALPIVLGLYLTVRAPTYRRNAAWARP